MRVFMEFYCSTSDVRTEYIVEKCIRVKPPGFVSYKKNNFKKFQKLHLSGLKLHHELSTHRLLPPVKLQYHVNWHRI